MKYLEKSFSTPANSKPYRDNWAATFRRPWWRRALDRLVKRLRRK